MLYVCETCDAELDATPEEAYSAGWDYPPFMGAWGVVSPRTCGGCLIDTTLWWALMVDKKTVEELSDRHAATLKRIQEEF